jgi:hypothetical protein
MKNKYRTKIKIITGVGRRFIGIPIYVERPIHVAKNIIIPIRKNIIPKALR